MSKTRHHAVVCGTMLCYLSHVPTVQYNNMGRGPRMKADVAKQLSVDVVYFEASEEQKRTSCAFWLVVIAQKCWQGN